MIAKIPIEFARANPKPKVTVCVVTFNQKDFIKQCLQSLIDQKTDFPFEVLVGDDCSTDGTSEVVAWFARKYPRVICHIRHPENLGPYRNYRCIHDLARGEFVAHLDGDDYALPGKLAVQEEFMRLHQKCVLSGHDVDVLVTDGSIVPQKKAIPAISDICALIYFGNFLCHSSTMYRRAFQLSRDVEIDSIDLQMHVDRVRSGKIGYINKSLGVYRSHSLGMMGTLYNNSTAMYYKNISAILKASVYCKDTDTVDYGLYKLTITWLKNLTTQGNYRLAKELVESEIVAKLTFRRSLIVKLVYFLGPVLSGIVRLKRSRLH